MEYRSGHWWSKVIGGMKEVPSSGALGAFVASRMGVIALLKDELEIEVS